MQFNDDILRTRPEVLMVLMMMVGGKRLSLGKFHPSFFFFVFVRAAIELERVQLILLCLSPPRPPTQSLHKRSQPSNVSWFCPSALGAASDKKAFEAVKLCRQNQCKNRDWAITTINLYLTTKLTAQRNGCTQGLHSGITVDHFTEIKQLETEKKKLSGDVRIGG